MKCLVGLLEGAQGLAGILLQAAKLVDGIAERPGNLFSAILNPGVDSANELYEAVLRRNSILAGQVRPDRTGAVELNPCLVIHQEGNLILSACADE